MPCPICDQKPMNCDCTAEERRQYGEIEELRAEIARLREAVRRLAEQDATLSVVGGNVIVEMDTTLTDAERAALHWFAHYGLPEHHAATLRGLLERLSPPAI